MKVNTALIMASGYGSRMLPVTAAVQKELLPILDRPVIDYVVADCIAASIKNIIFVIRADTNALQNYYTGNPILEKHLSDTGKLTELSRLKDIHSSANFEFVEQPAGMGYGTAVPAQIAASRLPKDEAFLLCAGDDFIWHSDGRSETAALIETFHQTKAAGALIGLERPADHLSRYGVIDYETTQQGDFLRQIIEKPTVSDIPEGIISPNGTILTNVSRYILTPPILEYIHMVKPNPASGELYVTDAIQNAAKKHSIAVHRAQGKFLDTGNVNGWLEANILMSQARFGAAETTPPIPADA